MWRNRHVALWRNLAALVSPVGAGERRQTPNVGNDWLQIAQLATAQLIGPSLHATMKSRGLSSIVEPDVWKALEAVHTLNAMRNDHFHSILRDTVQVLNHVGIRPLLLKGAIALLPGQYQFAGARMLGDLDIGVQRHEVHAANTALCAAGFDDTQLGLACYDNHHHLPPLLHPSRAAYIEIHKELLGVSVPASALSLQMLLDGAQSVYWEGVQVLVPTLEHRMLHNALHQQIQDRGYYTGHVRLRQLLEFAQLAASHEAALIDWPRLLAPLDATGLGDSVRLLFLLSHDLFGQPLPVGILPNSAAAAQSRVWFRIKHRRLSDLRDSFASMPSRLPHLHKRLLTPGWYPAKYRHLRDKLL